jgi:excinuclease ABC subunit C
MSRKSHQLAPQGDMPPDALDTDALELEDDGEEAPLPEDEEADSGADLSLGEGKASLLRGTEVIRGFWKTLPNKPGVYRMFDGAGHVLYVGKARSLKARVASYTRGQGHSNRIARMIAETAHMEFVTTSTETEALLLETNYIKQLKPRFNVLMRDDKSFPYIFVTGDHDAPQLTKHRGSRSRKGAYYGPFASVWAVNRTINALQRAFLLRTCSDSFYENRTRPCLLYQIKRCSGPCTGEVSVADYAGLVGEATAFLTGKSQAVKANIQKAMQEAADAMEFERAARYRDRLAALSAVAASQDINPQTVEEADVFAIHEQAGQFCIQVFFFRTYQNWGNRSYFPKADRSLTPAEVLDAFLGQFYDDKPCPRLVLLSHDIENRALLEEAFCARAAQRTEILAPKRGEKKDLVEHAASNAREALGRRLADTASQEKLLAALGTAFDLPRAPRRIDVFDNSHIMGTNAVGGMIVAGPGGFMKTHYRTFNIKSEELVPGDDYGMMREVLKRRFTRLVRDEVRELIAEGSAEEAQGDTQENGQETEFPAWPDLVLIDGGKGQLDAARTVLEEIGLTDVPLVGIAKGADRNAGRETFFIPGREPFRLSPRDPALYFVQRLRDEAHRFAIGTHRAKRKREMTKSPLDEIAGIGPTRKRALLLHFGTAKAVSRASLEDLMKTPGVNAATAKLVHGFFQKG